MSKLGLVEPKNGDSLSEALLQAMQQEERLDAMGQVGHQKVLGGYTWMHTAQSVLAFYQDTLAAK